MWGEGVGMSTARLWLVKTNRQVEYHCLSVVYIYLVFNLTSLDISLLCQEKTLNETWMTKILSRVIRTPKLLEINKVNSHHP